MRYRIFALVLIFVASCSTINIPNNFAYKEIKTRTFTLASWQKITQPQGVYKIYIEGDGYAFNAYGKPTQDPTPRGALLREIAFADPSPNVVYLARPCQFVSSPICSQRHWTTARFAPEVINAEYDAVKQIAGEHEVILIGFSGGAQIAGLISVAKPGLNTKKLITIAGNLDHLTWTQYHNLPPLNESLNLESYRQQYLTIPQVHFAGTDDDNIPPRLTECFVEGKWPIVKVEGATHSSGWENAYPLIWGEK